MLVEYAMANSGMFGLFGDEMEKFERDADEFKLFFNALGLWLNREIDKINSSSNVQSIEGVRRRALMGKAGVRKLLAEPTFELTTDGGRTEAVRLSLLTTAIEAEIEDSRSALADGDRSLGFRLKNSKDGAKAFRVDNKSGRPSEIGLQPEEVAKVLVEAAVRGHFV